MTDIRTLLRRDAEQIPIPDLWPEVLTRRMSGDIPLRSRNTVLWAGIAAFVAVSLGIFTLARVFLGGDASSPGQLPPSTSRPMLQSNGRIALIRIDPETVREGYLGDAALFLVEPNGSGLTRLTAADTFSSPAWAPDGSKLAFLSQGGISLIQADGKGMTEVVPCDAPECTGQGSPAWAPDSSKLAFWADRREGQGLWTVLPDGTELELLRSGLSFGQPSWSPDGKTIAVSGHPVADAGALAIHLIATDSGRILKVVRPEGLSPGFGVAWSPDGEWLAFDTLGSPEQTGRSGIYLMHPDGSGLELLTSWDCEAGTCAALQPAWSPDGSLVAFTRSGDEVGTEGSTGDLFLVDVETRKTEPLTEGRELDCCASWGSSHQG